MDSESWLLVVIGIIIGFGVGFGYGKGTERSHWETKAIAANVAEFVVENNLVVLKFKNAEAKPK